MRTPVSLNIKERERERERERKGEKTFVCELDDGWRSHSMRAAPGKLMGAFCDRNIVKIFRTKDRIALYFSN